MLCDVVYRMSLLFIFSAGVSQFQKIIIRFSFAIIIFTFYRIFSEIFTISVIPCFMWLLIRLLVLFKLLFTLMPTFPAVVFNSFPTLNTNSFILCCVSFILSILVLSGNSTKMLFMSDIMSSMFSFPYVSVNCVVSSGFHLGLKIFFSTFAVSGVFSFNSEIVLSSGAVDSVYLTIFRRNRRKQRKWRKSASNDGN